ncbi:hypothetical protein [Roseitalea sp. MMSF_3516]|uniref:hypothetical protein n=1 Tax=Roseitalea sp. MMSF_3516 TaxID=3046719 RepID=UPI00273D978A|nr:hypothetical protein [Roseitalea sp. MMSF_3516]
MREPLQKGRRSVDTAIGADGEGSRFGHGARHLNVDGFIERKRGGGQGQKAGHKGKGKAGKREPLARDDGHRRNGSALPHVRCQAHCLVLGTAAQGGHRHHD